MIRRSSKNVMKTLSLTRIVVGETYGDPPISKLREELAKFNLDGPRY